MKEFSSGPMERRGMKEFSSGPMERRGMKEFSSGPMERRGVKEFSNGPMERRGGGGERIQQWTNYNGATGNYTADGLTAENLIAKDPSADLPGPSKRDAN